MNIRFVIGTGKEPTMNKLAELLDRGWQYAKSVSDKETYFKSPHVVGTLEEAWAIEFPEERQAAE